MSSGASAGALSAKYFRIPQVIALSHFRTKKSQIFISMGIVIALAVRNGLLAAKIFTVYNFISLLIKVNNDVLFPLDTNSGSAT